MEDAIIKELEDLGIEVEGEQAGIWLLTGELRIICLVPLKKRHDDLRQAVLEAAKAVDLGEEDVDVAEALRHIEAQRQLHPSIPPGIRTD